MSKRLKAVKRQERLSLDLHLRCPDLNKGLSYEAKERKMKVYVDGQYAGFFNMETPIQAVFKGIKLRSVIVAEKVFEREDDTPDEVDFVQKYIVGQNFIECTFPKSGKVRRKEITFEEGNVLTLLQPQDFWKQK